jgi:putative endonuclease
MSARVDDRWFLYLARCGDGSLYAGIARDVHARIAAHDAGKGARYTRGRGPITLAASTRCKNKGEALRLEMALKALPRATKIALARRGLGPWARRVVRTRRAP